VDALVGLLDGPRARGAFLLRSVMSPPWSLRIQDRAPLTLMTMLRGDAWVVPDGGEAARLRPGDVAIVRGPDPYTVADDPATPPQAVIHPGQRCTTPDGEDLTEAMTWLGVRTWGNDPDGSAMMLSGTYQFRGEISGRLLGALPAMLVLPDDAGDSPLIARMLHNNPAHRWTVATLAAEIGVSRAALARRFAELVGEPPMTFLTGWRLALAADLLREPDATVGAVARQVGYGSPFALSTAFKRVRGISPRQHRAGASRS
jgi:AraC-like DNA-binding protein